ncbi:hypothetical protein VTH82DRAFT_379 [Thermothelomyces myriococcoides]
MAEPKVLRVQDSEGLSPPSKVRDLKDRDIHSDATEHRFEFHRQDTVYSHVLRRSNTAPTLAVHHPMSNLLCTTEWNKLQGQDTDQDRGDTQSPDDHGGGGDGSVHGADETFLPPSSQPVNDAAQPGIPTEDDSDADMNKARPPEGKEVEEPEGTNIPQKHHVSSDSTGMSDLDDDIFWQLASGPDDSTTFQVCDLVLQETFGITLREMVREGLAPMVYQSVGQCLDEISRIILHNGFGNISRGASELPVGTTGHGGGPVRLRRGGFDDSNTSHGSGGHNGGGDNGRKRPNGHGEDGYGPGGGSGDGGADGGGKRQKVSSTHQRRTNNLFSCPFRKRNPVRFNIRNSQRCAFLAFPDISQVKRHVKNDHKKSEPWPYTCQRCGQAMESKKALEEHISVSRDRICDPPTVPPSRDPEDGITSEIEETLNERKTGGKIGDWESLWALLFPGDGKIPEPDFVPPAELDEVRAQFDDSRNQLWQLIQEVVGRTENVQPIFDAFQSYINTVFEDCRLKTRGMSCSRRQARIQIAQRVASERFSVSPSLPLQRSGYLDYGSLVAAFWDQTYVPENLSQASVTETQPHIGNLTPSSDYSGLSFNGTGATVPELQLDGGGTAAIQGGQPLIVTLPASQSQIQSGSSYPDHSMGGISGDYLGRSTPWAPQTNSQTGHGLVGGESRGAFSAQYPSGDGGANG